MHQYIDSGTFALSNKCYLFFQAKTYAPAGNDNEALIQLCVDKLRILIEDNDQNLKYLGLLSMTRILGKSRK